MDFRTRDIISVEISLVNGEHYKVTDQQSISNIDDYLREEELLVLGKFIEFMPDMTTTQEQLKQFDHVYVHIDNIVDIKFKKRIE
ncbi:hypothetical protein H7K13_23880 [Priestia aryabhattai]|uniref:hypothetical protein n=1 Tax=Priestia aryabhattai TaxID=412384 RepID=UPI001C8E8920|nr:hypothetical protein [Priestia aryabhattai]MBY0077970.1 hypothetical protein [Priestia aryabhattai]